MGEEDGGRGIATFSLLLSTDWRTQMPGILE